MLAFPYLWFASLGGKAQEIKRGKESNIEKQTKYLQYRTLLFELDKLSLYNFFIKELLTVSKHVFLLEPTLTIVNIDASNKTLENEQN